MRNKYHMVVIKVAKFQTRGIGNVANPVALAMLPRLPTCTLAKSATLIFSNLFVHWPRCQPLALAMLPKLPTDTLVKRATLIFFYSYIGNLHASEVGNLDYFLIEALAPGLLNIKRVALGNLGNVANCDSHGLPERMPQRRPTSVATAIVGRAAVCQRCFRFISSE